MYLLLKHLHLTTVALSITLFIFRAFLHLQNKPLLQHKLIKILPHIIDTFLLITGISLMVYTAQYPTQQPWLLAKLLALICYILVGILFFRRCHTPPGKLLMLSIGLTLIGYMLIAALTKSAFPF